MGGYLLSIRRTAAGQSTGNRGASTIPGSPRAAVAVEIAAHAHQVGKLPAEHHVERRALAKGPIGRLDPAIATFGLGIEQAQRLVDADQVRQARGKIYIPAARSEEHTSELQSPIRTSD